MSHFALCAMRIARFRGTSSSFSTMITSDRAVVLHHRDEALTAHRLFVLANHAATALWYWIDE
jgi:hypothetical protein